MTNERAIEIYRQEILRYRALMKICECDKTYQAKIEKDYGEIIEALELAISKSGRMDVPQ